MSKRSKKNKKKPISKGAVIGLMVASAAMLAVMIFVFGFKTREVRYHGNTRLTTSELSSIIFDDKMPDNSLIFKFFGAKDKTLPFASEYEVALQNPEVIDIYVNEKPLVGYIKNGDEIYYIDDEGRVAEISDMIIGDVTRINGIDTGELQIGDKLPLPDEALKSVVTYADTFARYGIDAGSIDFDEEYLASLTVKDVKIYCGSGKNVNEKMERIKNITPRLDAVSGVIHMENFDGTSNDLYIQT